MIFSVFFFFQAEDGIRDDLVTGVQTCALPIYPLPRRPRSRPPCPLRRRPLSPRSEERRVGKSVDLGGRRIIKKKKKKKIKIVAHHYYPKNSIREKVA